MTKIGIISEHELGGPHSKDSYAYITKLSVDIYDITTNTIQRLSPKFYTNGKYFVGDIVSYDEEQNSILGEMSVTSENIEELELILKAYHDQQQSIRQLRNSGLNAIVNRLEDLEEKPTNIVHPMTRTLFENAIEIQTSFDASFFNIEMIVERIKKEIRLAKTRDTLKTSSMK